MKTFRVSENILFEDEDFVIINKPANLLSVPDRYQSNLPSLKSILRAHYGDIFVLHRLDFGTSGAICFGKHTEVQRIFTQMQEENQVGKIYHAFVQGVLTTDEGEIDVPLYYHNGKTFVATKKKGFKEAKTLYKRLESFGNYHHLLECRLISGRTHQIRVHLSHIGLPLLVDSDYGQSSAFYLSQIKSKYRNKKNKEERPLVYRQTLHSKKLEFQHPFKEELVVIEANYPKDLNALLVQLRNHIA